MKLFLSALALSALSLVSNATTFTVGSVSRDPLQNFMIDNLNHRDWMGWDKTMGYTLAQTIEQTGAGGVFAGYHIAQLMDAQMFVDALVGRNPCTKWQDFATCASGIAGISNVTGHNFSDDSRIDAISFLNERRNWHVNGDGTGIIISFANYDSPSENYLYKDNDAGTVHGSDYYAAKHDGFGYLLYKDAPVSVPEPSTNSLLSLVAIVFLWLQRRRCKAHIR